MALSEEEKKKLLDLYEKIFHEAKQLDIDFEKFKQKTQAHLDKQQVKDILEQILAQPDS